MHAHFISLYNGDWWYNVLGRVQSTCQSVTTETNFFPFWRKQISTTLLTSPSSELQMGREIITTIIIMAITEHWFSAVFCLYLSLFSRIIFRWSVFYFFFKDFFLRRILLRCTDFLCAHDTTNSVNLHLFLKCKSIIYIICKILFVK